MRQDQHLEDNSAKESPLCPNDRIHDAVIPARIVDSPKYALRFSRSALPKCRRYTDTCWIDRLLPMVRGSRRWSDKEIRKFN